MIALSGDEYGFMSDGGRKHLEAGSDEQAYEQVKKADIVIHDQNRRSLSLLAGTASITGLILHGLPPKKDSKFCGVCVTLQNKCIQMLPAVSIRI